MHSQRALWLLVCAISLTLAVLAAPLTTSVKVAGGFTAPIYDETGKLKYQIEGKEAKPHLGRGQLFVTPFLLKSFRPNGELELTVEAPDCVFDYATASSTNRLQVRSGNSEFTIEGIGFLWQQTNASLIISNNVHTRIQRGLIKSPASNSAVVTNPPAATNQTVDVFSDRFEYNPKTSVAIYRGKVTASDADRLKVACELLTAKLPTAGTRLESILAENNVVIDVKEKNGDLHATGNKAVYTLDTDNQDTVVLDGNPTWRMKLYEGKGDTLTFHSRNKEFDFAVRGHASAQMPRSALSRYSMTAEKTGEPSVAATTTNSPVQIFSDEYSFKPGLARFRGNVRVDNTPDWKLASSTLTVKLPSTGTRVENIVAEENVVVELTDKEGASQATGAKAVYKLDAEKAEFVELTGQPAWRTKQFEGKGDVLTLDPRRREFAAQGNASLKLFQTGMGAGGLLQLGLSPTNRAITSTDSGLEIFSDAYDVQPKRAVFHGHVRVDHPQLKLTCEEMTASFPATNRQIERLIAQRSVVLEQVETPATKPVVLAQSQKPAIKSQLTGVPWKLTCNTMTFTMVPGTNQVERIEADDHVIIVQGGNRAKSDKAVYTPLTGKIRLTGHPTIETADGKKITAPVLIMDRLRDTFEAEGAFRVEIPPEAVSKTNSARPNK